MVQVCQKQFRKIWRSCSYNFSFCKQESGFNRYAKPKRTKLFKIIPYKRPSSSLGYSQAVKKTWEQYKTETNNPLALRTRFKDSALCLLVGI